MEGHTIEGRDSRVVEEDDCAVRWGNEGLYVLSTPAILGGMERVCVAAIAAELEPGEMTVGVDVHLEHLAPTPMGDTVTYDVVMKRHGRGIDVDFTVTDAGGVVVSRGTHRRAVIDKQRFLGKLGRA
ncbi:hotdog domain-containing protein [Amycolatopsis sp. NPDC026612]|uniref:thioesterase family protein n=1 Tax=Amycolatopsis sp. NPDC026612 TaxID=3155466 RepID=UPI0033FA0B3D